MANDLLLSESKSIIFKEFYFCLEGATAYPTHHLAAPIILLKA
jgi:hypothetical protein